MFGRSFRRRNIERIRDLAELLATLVLLVVYEGLLMLRFLLFWWKRP